MTAGASAEKKLRAHKLPYVGIKKVYPNGTLDVSRRNKFGQRKTIRSNERGYAILHATFA